MQQTGSISKKRQLFFDMLLLSGWISQKEKAVANCSEM